MYLLIYLPLDSIKTRAEADAVKIKYFTSMLKILLGKGNFLRGLILWYGRLSTKIKPAK